VNGMVVGSPSLSDSIAALSTRLAEAKPKKIAILTHRGADVDALASAFGIREMLAQSYPSAHPSIHSVGKLPQKSRGLVEFLDLEVYREMPETKGSWIFLVDTGGWVTTGVPIERLSEAECRVLVDHHPLVDQSLYDIVLYYPSTSTSEIVLKMFDALHCTMEEHVSTALLAGVITDTAGLREANDETLTHLCELGSKGAKIAKVWEIVSREASRGETMAELKAAQRMKILKTKELAVVITEVGSYHSVVASALVRLGADLAIVFSRAPEGSKASMRASRRLSDLSSLDLGPLSAELARELGGHGGGHIRAGALSSSKNTKESLALAEKFLAKHLSQLRNAE
jgi:nanoRNase/pAp phosphatase (c-di-AMP/oligoRNAs hydrolase)